MLINANREGFLHVANYSYKFRKLIKSIAENAEGLLPTRKLAGIGIFLFGSPSRQEMVEESDADILIVRKEDNEDYYLFRTEFTRLLEKEGFPKIDLPEWGNYKDCENYIEHSITEGNQVIEAKFIYGDEKVNEHIELLREKYGRLDKFEKVFCFQKLYFDQYYKQRAKPGIRNVKYGHGGTRDFMFITWFMNIIDARDGRNINLEDNFPLVYKSLSSLYGLRLINLKDYQKYLESIDVVLILRNEILIQNKWTDQNGLTYLDDKTVKILFERGIFRDSQVIDEENLRKYLNCHLDNILELKIRLWDLFVSHIRQTRGSEYFSIFQKTMMGKIDEDLINDIDNFDELLKMVLIWSIDQYNNDRLFLKVLEKYKLTESWILLASICCHPQCPPKILDNIADKACNKSGFEYLLRIISRNKNVSNETLKKISDNPLLHERYKIVAQTAYKKGVEKANELR